MGSPDATQGPDTGPVTDAESPGPDAPVDPGPDVPANPDPDAGPTPDTDPGPGPLLTCSVEGLLPVASESPPLNDWQLEGALRALFPYEVDLSLQPHVTHLEGVAFSTFPGTNEILLSHAEELVDLSESLAMEAVAHIGQLVPCDPASGNASCAQAFIEGFAEKAFRRPVTPDEVAGFMALYNAVQSGSDPLEFDLAIGALVQAVVLSPHFLYLIELGEPTETPGVRILSDYEIASRLAFLFWNEPPDEILLTRAANGELQNKDNIREEAIRLLEDPRSTAGVGRFFGEWFGVADHLYSDMVSLELASAWDEEFRRFIEDLVYGEGTPADLLKSEQTWVNAPLAEHYGMTPTSGPDDWQLVDLPAERRGGVMTMAQFAAATSHNSATSIIHRGKAVRERLLCYEMGAPPPGATAQNPELGPDATVRDRMDARMEINPCGGCHMLMDPIGIGMEDLDEAGVFRSVYDNGFEVDSLGEVLVVPELEPEFDGVLDLAHSLADSETFANCASEQALRYATGRILAYGPEKSCHILQVFEDAEANGGRLRDLLIAVTQSDAFIYRQVEEASE